MNRTLKLVEELNMEVTVEATAEERTQEFKNWVIEKADVCERFLSIAMHNLDYWLNQREPINKALFNNKFEFVYFTINRYIQEAEWKCKDDGISGDVLVDVVKEFKRIKSKVRKEKAEYKQKFAELREAIRTAKENEEYVADVTSQVEKNITDWCSTYVISAHSNTEFVGDRLAKTIAYVTNMILSKKLNPNEDDVVMSVQKFMRNHTETVACQ